MKRWCMLVLPLIIGMITVPAISAEGEYTVNSAAEDTSAPAGVEYIVSPYIENSSDTDVTFSARSIQYIIQGQTITHYVGIGSGVNHLEVDLNWGDTSDSLTLSVYTPSGSKIGTYRDNYDGCVNGRIRLNIDPSQGYVEQGTWQFKVYGESVSGTEDYTFNVYQH